MEPAGPAGGAPASAGAFHLHGEGGESSKKSTPVPHPEGRRGAPERGVNASPSMSTGWWHFCPANAAGEGGRYSSNQRRTPLLPRSAAHRPCPVLRREDAARGTTTPGVPRAPPGGVGRPCRPCGRAQPWSPHSEEWL